VVIVALFWLDEWDFICSCLEECSHISLDRLRQRLEEERGLKVSHVTVWHIKKHFMPVSRVGKTLLPSGRHGQGFKRKSWMFHDVFCR